MRAGSGLSDRELDDLQLAVLDGVAEGRDAIRGLLERGIRFDAVVCASDSLGLGALLVVGADTPVIGYDNTPVADAVGLSSVEQPLAEVAGGVLSLLAGFTPAAASAGAAAAPAPLHRLVEPKLVLRHRRIGSVRS
jgi:DNA-binding LacI/PurR family transcriptional regulator